jgi:hypothetical protein
VGGERRGLGLTTGRDEGRVAVEEPGEARVVVREDELGGEGTSPASSTILPVAAITALSAIFAMAIHKAETRGNLIA